MSLLDSYFGGEGSVMQFSPFSIHIHSLYLSADLLFLPSAGTLLSFW